jgi:hypothetical protein
VIKNIKIRGLPRNKKRVGKREHIPRRRKNK